MESSASPALTNSTVDTHRNSDASNLSLVKTNSSSTSTDFPSKTDKPKPHVCTTCSRSFARLEHLKRHERSHTKEKPFECPECSRCFARRDLLLRHQQKLHLTVTPTSRSKARRESTNSTSSSTKIRKVSSASQANGASPNGSSRQRSHTISHIDGPTLDMLADVRTVKNENTTVPSNISQQNTLLGSGRSSSHIRGMSATLGNHGSPPSLPRLATHGLNANVGMGLRTAPPGPAMGTFGFDPMYSASTINPAQLSLDDSIDTDQSAFRKHFENHGSAFAAGDEEENFDWLRNLNAHAGMQGHLGTAIAPSSASAMSDGTPENMMDTTQDDFLNIPHTAGMSWQDPMASNYQTVSHFPLNSGFTFGNGHPEHNGVPMQQQPNPEAFYPSPASNARMSPNSAMSNLPMHFNSSIGFQSDGTSLTSSSMNGSARHSSITSISTESITDATRQALLLSLASAGSGGMRRYPQPAVSSPLSPHAAAGIPSLPSTSDLQRYVSAYITYFHPHFPFLHIPTLCFDSPAYTNNVQPTDPASAGHAHGGIVGGAGCLVLAMAAIGALYEFERAASKDCFDSAKKMIQLYLEQRRKAEAYAASNGTKPNDEVVSDTPVWLVQAMLLNVIYGHNCGDKISGDIASQHCTALVSLARAAGLLSPLTEGDVNQKLFQNANGLSGPRDVQMTNEYSNHWNASTHMDADQAHWHRWILVEERKRTLYAIFHMSSMLVMAYNHAPALSNSEIPLELPCEEDLWAAESARSWTAKGGAVAAEQRAVPFATALTTLLTASQSNGTFTSLAQARPFGSGVALAELPPSNLQPSTFGCLALINALHNYIWETRQRHIGRKWSSQETEAMYAQIEPALRAWQASWASNPYHSLERPNPYGYGPLSADSIPLLDLAYVRLFVNLGKSKDYFWNRDFDAMSEELARGSEIIQHAENSDTATNTDNSPNASRNSPDPNMDTDEHDEHITIPPHHSIEEQSQSSKRERHLRKAAFYAADSLSMSDKLGITFADFTSRELPLQSGLCTFDCAQVLAEWISTVQERVGRYLGVLGRDPIDYAQVPAIILLEDEDCKLLEKISDILNKAEAKMTFEIRGMENGAGAAAANKLAMLSNKGYGSKILLLTAYMLERAAVWPVTSTMAYGLTIQADHMQKRAETSTIQVAQ